MISIKHRFSSHIIHPQTEILIIGTFNPETPENKADFFYGRHRNFLWTLIPVAFGDNSLKGKSKEEKVAYIQRRKIDFIDLITEVQVEEPDNYDDSYLDKNISGWTDIICRIEKLKNLKKVCFTRKSFADIPNMKIRLDTIKNICQQKNIFFQCVTTPARFYRADKQKEWTAFLVGE
jgi:G:T/U-mismatch repair DNA glycosylase